MNSKAGKLLVVESDNALREQIVTVLNDAGYEVSTDYREGIKQFHRWTVRSESPHRITNQ